MMVVMPPPWELETAVVVGVFGVVERSAGLAGISASAGVEC